VHSDGLSASSDAATQSPQQVPLFAWHTPMLDEALHHWHFDDGVVHCVAGATAQVLGHVVALGRHTSMPSHHEHPAEDGRLQWDASIMVRAAYTPLHLPSGRAVPGGQTVVIEAPALQD
jgi:hypothetical protein